MHFLVARSVAGVGAGRVDDHAAAGIAGLGIKYDVAAFKLERAVNRVHCCAQRELNGGARRIEINGHLLRFYLRRAKKKQPGGNTH